MTTIELLKEAWKQLVIAHNHLMMLSEALPISHFALVDSGIIQDEGFWIDTIDAYLTANAIAMKIVKKRGNCSIDDVMRTLKEVKEEIEEATK